jgi:copper homeostasis protein
MRPLFEVIVLDARDAKNAQAGGADRVELVREMDRDGLTPPVELFKSVRAATGLPIRVMLRADDGFQLEDVNAMRATARGLRRVGADEFVLGFLTAAGEVDVTAMQAVLDELDGAKWTFHRAIDHAVDREAAWSAISSLSNVDTVLTSGGRSQDLDRLIADSVREPRVMAGGGLREEHLPALLAGGVTAFHAGAAVRPSWGEPVEPRRVERWREILG